MDNRVDDTIIPLNPCGDDDKTIKRFGDDKVKLSRNIGVWTGISIVMGSMIGSGIFVSTKGVLLGSGSVGLSLIIWLGCGIVAILGSLIYVELGCMLPKAGGDYEYINQAFGSIPSFLFAWTTVFLILPAANAIAGLTFSDYVLQPFFNCDSFTPSIRFILAILVVLLVSFVNCINQRLVAGVQNVFTFGKVLALVIIVLIGIVFAVKTKLSLFREPFKMKIKKEDKESLVSAIYSGLFSFAGWNTLNFIGEEIKRPERDMPVAIVSGISLTTVIYLFVNAAYFVILTPQEIIDSNAVAVTYSEEIWLSLGNIMSAFVALSTFGYLNGMTMATSRIAFSAARRHHMPRFLCLINYKNQLPICAVMATTIVSILLLFIGDLYRLISIASCAEYIFILLSVLGMITLRRRHPEWKRPYKAPMWIAIFFSICCIFVIIMTFVSIPIDGLICFGFMAIGLALYSLCKQNNAVKLFLAKYTAILEERLQKLTLSEFDLSSN